MQIKIDTEFKKLIPPLSGEEYSQLEQNIIDDGCRDPIVIWNDTIVDGHNRHKICTDNNIEFKTESIEFDSREDVIIWMIYNQFGKRNITSFVRGELALKLEPMLKIKAEENRVKSRLSTLINETTTNTQKKIAKEAKQYGMVFCPE